MMRFFLKIVLRCKRKIYEIYARKKVKSMGKKIYINHRCKFTNNMVIGDNCHFNGICVSGGGGCIIGDNFHSGEDILVITQNHNYKGTRLPYDNEYVCKDVVIGKNCWIGSRVIILPGTKLGDGVIVQAGSVVHGVIPNLAICGGNPANVFAYRDKEHYNALEESGMYW